MRTCYPRIFRVEAGEGADSSSVSRTHTHTHTHTCNLSISRPLPDGGPHPYAGNESNALITGFYASEISVVASQRAAKAPCNVAYPKNLHGSRTPPGSRASAFYAQRGRLGGLDVVNELLRDRRAPCSPQVDRGLSRDRVEPIQRGPKSMIREQGRGFTREPVTLVRYHGLSPAARAAFSRARRAFGILLVEDGIRVGVSWNRSLPEETSSAPCSLPSQICRPDVGAG